MSGIAGRYCFGGLMENHEWAGLASRLLHHRGPDGEGGYHDRVCELVFRQFQPPEVSASCKQPIPNEDGSVFIVNDGDIHNFDALRAELIRKGHQLRSTSGSEVLLHLYEEYGPAMFERIQGSYAFAIYDQRQRTLLLARDHYGTKPLYYTQYQDQWIFASELKAVLAWPGLPSTVDRQAVYDFLSWGYVPEPLTGFKAIFALPKGSYLLITPQGGSPHEYYRTQIQPDFHGTFDEAVETTGEHLQQAVRSRLVPGRPLASLLSGGIDSALVAAACKKVTNQELRTFTIHFPDVEFDESALAKQSAEYIHAQHILISCADRRFDQDEAVELLAHYDQPYADTSLFAVSLVTRCVRDHGIRTIFSGDGGDDAFGGHLFYSHLPQLLSLRRIPGFARSAAETASAVLLGSRRPGTARQVRRAVGITRGHTPADFLMEMISYQTEQQKEALIVPDARAGLQPASRWFEPYHRGWTLEDLSAQLTTGLFELSLPGEMTKKVDMMSMKNSVESQAPILDDRLIQFAQRIPHQFKATERKNKLVLRALAERWLPPEVSRAKKRGFTIPMDVMAGQTLKEMIQAALLSTTARIRPIIQPAVVSRWVRLFQEGLHGRAALEVSREGLYQRVFFLLSLEVWMQKYQLTFD